MTQPKKSVRKRKENYGDLDFAGWSQAGWVESVVTYLGERDRGTAIGSLTLAVVGVACCTVSSPIVLTTVVSITAGFATLVLLLDRKDEDRRQSKNDTPQPGRWAKKPGEFGAP